MATDTKNPERENDSRATAQHQAESREGPVRRTTATAQALTDLQNALLDVAEQLSRQDLPPDRLPTKDWPVVAQGLAPDAGQARRRIAAYRREISRVDPLHRAQLLTEIAEVQFHELNDGRTAFETLAEALAQDPKSVAAVEALPRLLGTDADWAVGVELMKRALVAANAGPATEKLLLLLGCFQAERLQQLGPAVETFGRLLLASPAEPLTLETLFTLYLREEDWGELATLCREIADSEEDRGTRYGLLMIAALAFDGSERGERARIAAQALEALPQGELALLLSVSEFSTQGDWEEAVRVLADAAIAAPERNAFSHFEISRILADKLGRTEEALVHAERARAHNPDNRVLLGWLAELYRRETRWEELLAVLSATAATVPTEDEAAELRLTIAEILDARLERPEDALSALEPNLSLKRLHVPSLQALGRIYSRLERWEELAVMHLLEAERQEKPRAKALALFRCGHLLAERLHRVDEAVGHLQAALDLAPGEPGPSRLLEQILRRERRHDDLLALYRKLLRVAQDDDQRVRLFERLGALLDFLGEPRQAMEAYQAILDLRPSYLLAMQALARLHHQVGDYSAMLSVMRGIVSTTVDLKEKAELLAYMAQVMEEHLDDPKMALAHFEEALRLAPDNAELAAQTGRLLAAAGRFADVVTLYQKQLEHADGDAARAELQFRIGWICEHQLDNAAEAKEAYRAALGLYPNFATAFRGLLRTAQQLLDLELLELCERDYLEVCTADPQSRAAVRLRLGLLFEDEGQPETARRLYDQALVDDSDGALAKCLKLKRSVQDGAWKDVCPHLPPFSAGLVAAAALKDLEQGLASFAGRDPDGAEDLAAARFAELMLFSRENDSRWPAAMAKREALEQDVRRKQAAQLRKIGRNVFGAHPSPLGEAELRALLDGGMEQPAQLAVLERAARSSGLCDALCAVLKKEVQAAAEPKGRASARCALARELKQAGRIPEAIAEFQRALDDDPSCRPAYDMLKIWYWEAGDLAATRRVLEQAVDVTADAEVLALDLLRRADLRLADGESDQAVEDLERVLSIKPDQPNALDRLTSLLQQSGNVERIVTYLERAADYTPSAKQRAELLYRLGTLFEKEVGALERAERFLARAITADPDAIEILMATARVRVLLDQPTEALALLNRVAIRATRREDLLTARLEIARICVDLLQDPLRARSSLDAVLSIDPGHSAALRRMVQVAESLRDWARLESSLRALTKTHDLSDEERAKYLAQLAWLLWDVGPAAPEEPMELLAQALALAPGNPKWLRELVGRYENAAAWEQAEALLRAQIEALPAAERPGFLIRRGQLLGNRLGRHDEARDVLREALKDDPENAAIVEHLLEHIDTTKLTGAEEIGEAIRLHQLLLAQNPTQIDLLRALHRLLEQSGRVDEAFVLESCLVVLGAASEEEVYFFKQRRRKSGNPKTSTIDAEQLTQIALPRGDHPVRALLALLDPYLSELFPIDPEHYGLESLQSSQLSPGHRVYDLAAQCGELLGVTSFAVVEVLGGAPRGACEPGTPSTLVVPESFSRLPVPEQRFMLGRLLTRLGLKLGSVDPGRGEALGVRELELIAVALGRTADPEFGANTAPAAILDDLVGRLTRTIPAASLEPMRHAAAAAWSGQARATLADWLRTTELGANRGGLLCCGALASAVGLLRRTTDGPLPDEMLGDLIGFSVSAIHAALRKTLGLAITE